MEGRFVELSEPNDLQKPHNWENPWHQTFCTVFEGAAPVEGIRTQLAQIVAANPWLVGRLRTSPVSGEPAIWVPAVPDLGSSYVEVCEDGCVDSVLDSLGTTACSHLMPKAGAACLDKDEPLFILQLAADTRQNRFLLTSSLTHHVGDGASHYKIYSMLNPGSTIEALAVDRVKYVDALVADMAADTMRKWGLQYALEPAKLPGEPVPLLLDFYVNADWVAEQKSQRMPVESSDEVPWLSTNDILTSWFFMAAKPCLGMIMVDARGKVYPDRGNMRNKLADLQLTDRFVGNYHDAYLFLPAEYAEPANIRRAITRLSPAECAGHPAEVGAEEKGGALITSWVAVFQELQFDGCRQILHFPFGGGDLASLPADPTMIIFKAAPNRLACRVVGRDARRLPKLGADSRFEAAIGEIVDFTSACRA